MAKYPVSTACLQQTLSSDKNPPTWGAKTLSERGLYKYSLFLPAISPHLLLYPKLLRSHLDWQACSGRLPWRWTPLGGAAGRLGAGLWVLECTSSEWCQGLTLADPKHNGLLATRAFIIPERWNKGVFFYYYYLQRTEWKLRENSHQIWLNFF